MNHTPHKLAAVLLIVTASVACQEVELQPLTNAPPTREASVDTPNHRVRLSEGVALAVRCWDTCDSNCRGARVTASNPRVRVHRAYRLADLNPDPYSQGYNNNKESVFVLLGQERGESSVKVESSCGSQTYSVSVTP